MHNGLLHAHSGLRYVVLLLLLVAIFNAFSKKKSGTWTGSDKKIALFTLIFTHIQLVLGFLLYFNEYSKVSFASGFMENKILRFYTVEHISLMLVAIALITIGYSKSKRAATDAKKFGAIAVFYLIGLVLILAAIPWPFRELGAEWF